MRDGERRRAFLSSLCLYPSSRFSRYAPLVAWAALIFLASSASFSASNTSRIIRPLLLWLFPDMTEDALLQAHFLVRKAAHFTEYAILSLLAARAFLNSPRERVRGLWRLASFAVVAGVATLDEFRQSFLPSRTGTVYDSLLDMAGGAVALAVVTAWRLFLGRRGGDG